VPTTAAVNGVMRTGNPLVYSDHLWASAFVEFGFKSEPPAVQLKAVVRAPRGGVVNR
jgi:hypothetical protein